MKIEYIQGTNLAICDGYKFRKDKRSGYWYSGTLREFLHRYVYEKCYGKTFEVNKYYKNETCSKHCAMIIRWKNKK